MTLFWLKSSKIRTDNIDKQHLLSRLLSSLWQWGWKKEKQLAVNAIGCVFKRNIFHSKGLVVLSGSKFSLVELLLVSELVIPASASYSINSVSIV